MLSTLGFVATVREVPGYVVVNSAGKVRAYGGLPSKGSLPTAPANSVAGIAETSDGRGYVVTTSQGVVTSFGDAPTGTSLPTVSHSIVGVAMNPNDTGYWNGAVYQFGAPFFGDRRGVAGAATIGMTASPDDGGYLLVRRGGGVSAFGDAKSGGAVTTADPIVGVSHP